MDSQINIYHRLKTIGFIPVGMIEDDKNAVPLANALIAGELPCIEIALRTEKSLSSITKISKNCPDIIVGAGTVLSVDQVKEAIDVGAQFIVTPGFNTKVVEYCVEHNIAIIPGTAGAAHIDAAIELDVKIVKFFPAEKLGGLPMVESLGQIYPISFFSTGGIDATNLGAYIRSKHIHCVGGTWVTSHSLISRKRFEEITLLAKKAVSNMLGFSLMHVGINANGQENAKQVSDEFATLLGGSTREVPNLSYFVGSEYEIMFDGLGLHGHLAFGTNSMDVAMRVLSARGYTFNKDFIRYDANKRLFLAYLEKEIGGFACHLVQKN